MPKINVNGVTREMTLEEITQMEQMRAEMPEPEIAAGQRLDALEAAADDIILMMAELIGGNV